MEWNITTFKKIFGSGPTGFLISVILLIIALWIDRQIGLPPLSDNQTLLNAIFIVASLMTLVIVIWSFVSLPAADRGKRLVTSGAFRYVRHPLYAAFLSVFNFGLAIYLKSYIMVLWAILLHPVWHYLVRDEEEMMVHIFGKDYEKYQEKTGRFFPRLL
ncbi:MULTISPECIES: isoprenylcysteine carboxylmethyltransferase family protein [unclassified Methanoregula]|uniref:methyltransferase family protein n=1 Tax=unclassified Methanoregula TaxID=2649730 RepID=UPI0009D4802D|nr:MULTISPECIES: isoprenylcysteine carboxylmethyltransferase family protein [unclassified Methanoregula]OPX64975.1 MAG: hypothetical protein A4E33_00518 [Methanoregula sp. PtaB.Bin085]OPY35097.1 MAG: hypothetical protein A4E34_01023 [Methanoregula sp. PtaU1.Bin006]